MQASAIEFHELIDHAFFAQHLRNQQNQIGCCDTLSQFARHLEADHFRQQHGLRLAQHCRFGFNATDTPTEYAKAIDHGGV